MVKAINMLELRRKIGEVLDETYYKKDRFLVKRNRKTIAAIIPLEDYFTFIESKDVEEYTSERIKEFLEADKVDFKTAQKVEKILASDKPKKKKRS